MTVYALNSQLVGVSCSGRSRTCSASPDGRSVVLLVGSDSTTQGSQTWLRPDSPAAVLAQGLLTSHGQRNSGGGSRCSCCAWRVSRQSAPCWRACTAAPRSVTMCSVSPARPPRRRSLVLTGSWLAGTTPTASGPESPAPRGRPPSPSTRSSCSLPPPMRR